jgi:hypothetical protein
MFVGIELDGYPHVNGLGGIGVSQKMRITRVRVVIQDASVQYVTDAGDRIPVTLPRGTVLELPTDWIYNGVPSERINTNDLLE